MSEAFDAARWRPAAFLPEQDARDPALMFVIAVLCFLACLTALGALAGDRGARGWTGQLVGEATVIARARGGETPDAAAARVAEALAGLPGVTEVRALEKEKAYDLIRPWIGDVANLDDLPVPRLVAVTLDRKAPATSASLDQALKRQKLDAVVDDHSIWIKDIRRAAGVVRGTAIVIFVLIAAAAAAVVALRNALTVCCVPLLCAATKRIRRRSCAASSPPRCANSSASKPSAASTVAELSA
jgi:cell division transport system permease protein